VHSAGMREHAKGVWQRRAGSEWDAPQRRLDLEV
jgi:hypothetical protein